MQYNHETTGAYYITKEFVHIVLMCTTHWDFVPANECTYPMMIYIILSNHVLNSYLKISQHQINVGCQSPHIVCLRSKCPIQHLNKMNPNISTFKYSHHMQLSLTKQCQNKHIHQPPGPMGRRR